MRCFPASHIDLSEWFAAERSPHDRGQSRSGEKKCRNDKPVNAGQTTAHSHTVLNDKQKGSK